MQTVLIGLLIGIITAVYICRGNRKLKNDLSGEVALVTGGAGGLGNAICSNLLKQGAKVIIWDNDDSRLQKTKSKFEKIITQKVDLSSTSRMQEAARTVLASKFLLF